MQRTLRARRRVPFAAAQVAAATVVALALLAGSAQSQLAVSGELVREHIVLPGRQYTSSVTVRNPSAVEQDVRVSLADYRFAADGSSQFEPTGTLSRSLASWLSFAPRRVTLDPGETTEITYTVTVPAGSDGDALSGSYWTAMLVESQSIASNDVDVERGELGLASRLRYAVQIAAHVNPDQDRELDLSNVGVTRTGSGAAVLTFDVRNTGGIAYRPLLEIQVFDEDGGYVGAFRHQRGLLFPGTSLRQEFELGALEPGGYEVFLTIDTGAVDLLGSQFRITL